MSIIECIALAALLIALLRLVVAVLALRSDK